LSEGDLQISFSKLNDASDRNSSKVISVHPQSGQLIINPVILGGNSLTFHHHGVTVPSGKGRYNIAKNQAVSKKRLFRLNIPENGTLKGTHISPNNGTVEDDFPFPRLGYVSSLEGNVTFERKRAKQHNPGKL